MFRNLWVGIALGIAALAGTATSANATTTITFDAANGHFVTEQGHTYWREGVWGIHRFVRYVGWVNVQIDDGVFVAGSSPEELVIFWQYGEDGGIIGSKWAFTSIDLDGTAPISQWYVGFRDWFTVVVATPDATEGMQTVPISADGSTYLALSSDRAFSLDNVVLLSVPEPSTWGMLIVGFGAVGSITRHRRRRAALTLPI